MKWKRVAKVGLLGFVGLSVAVIAYRAVRPSEVQPASKTASNGFSRDLAVQPGDLNGQVIPGVNVSAQTQAVVFYFHSNVRCPSCMAIEKFTDEAMTSGFSDKLAKSTLMWQRINIDDDGNRHFVSNYQLYSKSVIVAVLENGIQKRWKNLERVWELLDNRPAFIKYVQDEVHEALGKQGT